MIDETLPPTEETTTPPDETQTEITTEEPKEEAVKDEDESIDVDKIEPETRTKAEIKADEAKKDEDETDLDPEDEKRIRKVVGKEMSGVSEKLAKLQKLENESEVNALIASKPEFSKYKPAILKYMDHPAYSNIPAHNIAAIVAGKDLMKLGAQKEREVAQKVKETQTPGEAARKTTTATDWSTASKADFEAQKAKIMRQT